jgi:3-phytase
MKWVMSVSRVSFAASKMALRCVVFFGWALPGVGAAAQLGKIAKVSATVETTPVNSERDAADDPAIWIHPTDVALSTVIGTDKKGALEVYRISDGVRIHRERVATGNVDLRYNFPLTGAYRTGQTHERVTLVCSFRKASVEDESPGRLGIWKVNPHSSPPGALEAVEASSGVDSGNGGTAMYVSPRTGKFYVFQNNEGQLVQSELKASTREPGRVNAIIVRTISFTTGKTESVVADDALQFVYVSDEAAHTIYRFDAEPDGGTARVAVGTTILQSDTEGLAIYPGRDGRGYLIVSNQGANDYAVFQRQPPANGGGNEFVGRFSVVDGVVDGTSSTDGIEVCNFPVGGSADFPRGVLVLQDGRNPGANQNFKLVPWERIAGPLGLAIDVTWDPRRVGAGQQESNHR